MTAAVFTATFADWKLVKTRGVVQVVLEVPLEKSDEAYRVVGGMPDPAKERWFAIARLKPESEVMQNTGISEPSEHKTPPRSVNDNPSGGTKSWHEIRPAQQAGILCGEVTFHRFLQEYCGKDWKDFAHLDGAATSATFCVRRLCNGIASRRELIPGTPAADKWRELVGFYRAWMREAEVV